VARGTVQGDCPEWSWQWYTLNILNLHLPRTNHCSWNAWALKPQLISCLPFLTLIPWLHLLFSGLRIVFISAFIAACIYAIGVSRANPSGFKSKQTSKPLIMSPGLLVSPLIVTKPIAPCIHPFGTGNRCASKAAERSMATGCNCHTTLVFWRRSRTISLAGCAQQGLILACIYAQRDYLLS